MLIFGHGVRIQFLELVEDGVLGLYQRGDICSLALSDNLGLGWGRSTTIIFSTLKATLWVRLSLLVFSTVVVAGQLIMKHLKSNQTADRKLIYFNSKFNYPELHNF